MKKIFFLLAALAALTANAADRIVPLTVAFDATLTVQAASTDDGTTTIIPEDKLSITTKRLLEILAQDEFNEGVFLATNFPTGSKLVLVYDDENPTNSYFVVENSADQVLVNVSGLLQFEITGNDFIESGRQTDATGLMTARESYIGTLLFDDTGAGGTLQFSLQGLGETSITDSRPRFVNYTETIGVKFSNGNGEGSVNGNPATISGSSSGKGRADFVLP